MKFHPFRAWRSGSPSPLSTAYLHPTLKTWKMTLYDPHVIICAGLFLQHFVAQIYRFKRALLTTCPNPSWALRLALDLFWKHLELCDFLLRQKLQKKKGSSAQLDKQADDAVTWPKKLGAFTGPE